jgi:Fe-S-cluster-containing hydrogenase component 2
MNLFIHIELTPAAQTLTSLVTLCPVNIFALRDGQVIVQDERQDECTLCELCLKAAPAGTIRIHKLYEETSKRGNG